MHTRHRQDLLAALVLLALVAAAGAAPVTVVLTDGRTYLGEITEETSEQLTVRLQDGKVAELPATLVARIIEADGTARDYEPPAPPPEPAPEPEPDPADREGELRIEIPELLPVDCHFCGGYGKHDCPLCGGQGQYELRGKVGPCKMCRGKKHLRCEGCKGTGDTPEVGKTFLCPACAPDLEYSLGPGKWVCPTCGGPGTVTIVGNDRPLKCMVCWGKGWLPCTCCTGSGRIKRLFPRGNTTDPEGWLERCQKGQAAILASELTDGNAATPQDLRRAAGLIPRLQAVAKVLAKQLQRAGNLERKNIQGTDRMRAFFQRATGLGVGRMLASEYVLLKEEETWVKGKR
jgi:hypothetical protein